MLVSDECPVEDCNCLACVIARGYAVKGSKYVWGQENRTEPTREKDFSNFPYSIPDYASIYADNWVTDEFCNCSICRKDRSSIANEESVPTERIEKTFYPYGIYRFNYSTVDGYGFGATHSIVLEVLQAMTPAETFSNFMDLGGASGIRYHLIEYFMVRWENGEYVRV